MGDNWDEDLPSEGMKAKIYRKCHVSFSRLDCGNSLDCNSVIHLIFRIGLGVGIGVDQEPGVRAGVGVGTAPPQLCSCTPASKYHPKLSVSILKVKVILGHEAKERSNKKIWVWAA